MLSSTITVVMFLIEGGKHFKATAILSRNMTDDTTARSYHLLPPPGGRPASYWLDLSSLLSAEIFLTAIRLALRRGGQI